MNRWAATEWELRARLSPEPLGVVLAIAVALGYAGIITLVRPMPVLLAGLAAIQLVFGGTSAAAAANLGRSARVWFAIGLLGGPIGLLVLRVAPPAVCRSCGSPTRSLLPTCWWCLQDVRGARRQAPEATPVPIAPPAARPSLDVVPVRRPDAPVPPPPHMEARPQARPEPPPPTRPEPPPQPMPEPRPQARPEPRLQTRPEPPPQPVIAAPGAARVVLATAIYVTGTTALESGRRYGIAIAGQRFQILGPTDADPERVTIDRAIAGLEARALEGRLILGHADGLVAAFMAVAGLSPRDVVASIDRASGRSATTA